MAKTVGLVIEEKAKGKQPKNKVEKPEEVIEPEEVEEVTQPKK